MIGTEKNDLDKTLPRLMQGKAGRGSGWQINRSYRLDTRYVGEKAEEAMNYDRITYFIKAAELLNFSEAARQLYITPQAFGRQISLLENELGTALFTRSRHKISLTFEGEIIYKHMAPLVSAIEREYREMQNMVQKRSGKLNIGILSFLSRSKCISPVITEIYSSHSSIDINTQMYEMRELMEAADSGEIDLGITIIHDGLVQNENYEVIPLIPGKTELMVSLYHPWVTKETVTEEDMKKENHIRFDIEGSEKNPYIRYPCKKDIIVENYATMLSELERGAGYVIASPDISELSLLYHTKSIPLPGNPFYVYLAILYKKTEIRKEVLDLVERIREIFEP